MPSTARIVETVPFHSGDIVGMSRTRNSLEGLIVRRAGVAVSEYDGNRTAGGPPLKHSAENLRLIRFDSRGSTLGPALTAEDIRHQVLGAQAYSSLDPVYNYSDPGPVGFSEYADSETVSETIHLSSIFADNIHTCKYTIFSAVSHYICFKLTARLSRKKSTADRAIHYPVDVQPCGGGRRRAGRG